MALSPTSTDPSSVAVIQRTAFNGVPTFFDPLYRTDTSPSVIAKMPGNLRSATYTVVSLLEIATG